MMKKIAIIEARMSSTRLPGKVLRSIMGRPMLALLVERLQGARQLDGVVVATTVNPADDPIEALTQKLGIGCFRGSEEDVLDRVLQAAHAFAAEVIIEITGDCPLIESTKVDAMVSSFIKMSFDFMVNRLDGSYPDGLGLRIFKKELLQKVDQLTKDPVDREHVTLYVWEHPELFSIYHYNNHLNPKYWDLRLTVDTPEDFDLISKIFEELYPGNRNFGLPEIIDLLERKPEMLGINRHIMNKPVR
jgi:spore coat polysaccharide biosynthesis protein SpsF